MVLLAQPSYQTRVKVQSIGGPFPTFPRWSCLSFRDVLFTLLFDDCEIQIIQTLFS